MKPLFTRLFVILAILLVANLTPAHAQEGSGTKASEAIKNAVDTKNTSGTKEEELKKKLKELAGEVGKKFPDNADSVKIHFDREARKIRDRNTTAKGGYGVKNNKELVKWLNDLLSDLSRRQLVENTPGLKDSGLLAAAKGTGRTTGHIATLSLKNVTNKHIAADIGPYLIPSGGNHQPYIVPASSIVNIGPNSEKAVPIYGFCVDIHRPPVPAGEPMPSVSSWVETGSGLDDNWQPSANRGWEPPGANVDLSDSPMLLIPGTDSPLNYIINPDKHPDEAAPVILELISRITETYDNMAGKGNIATPFSGNPEKERESVIQQTFWIATAALTGTAYKLDNFKNNTEEQFEESTGQKFEKLKPKEKEELNAGINSFWNTFQAVGVEAKILASLDDIKKKEDFDVWRRKKYDDYTVEREINNKSHEAACKAIGVDPDSDLGKALKRVYDGEKGKK